MRALRSGARLGVFAGLVLAISAAPGARAAAPARMARAKAADVSFLPLFDTNGRFKVRKEVKLRFRASRRLAALENVSISLRRDPRDGDMRLPVRRLKGGVLEVPFAPMWPGEYVLAIEVGGASKRSVSHVSLGVVGVAPGLIDVPPEEDGEVLQQRRGAGRLSR